MHADALIEIGIVAMTALVWGLLLQRLRQPPIVGYIFAGVCLGPSILGLIDNRDAINVFAELGVLLLLFTIGMELSLRGFKRVYRVALIGAGSQIFLSVGIMLLLSRLFGWSTEAAVLGGFVVAISSTAVAMKILQDIGELRSDVGRTAVGVLIAQDLAVIPMLLVIESMARSASFDLAGVAKTVVAIGLLAAMIAYLTRRERVRIPFAEQLADNIELAALSALAFCFGAALLSGLLGLSPAYGAFLAGLWIGNSNARPGVLRATMPIQSVLLMAFFLSIGLLLDLRFIWENLGQVVVLLIIVTLFKTAMNVLVLRMAGEPWPRAWLAGVVIGQIGEFSFVLAAAGIAAGVISADDNRMLVSVIALSLMISPFWLVTARRMERVKWQRVLSLRQLFRALYGRETRAVVAVSNRAVAETKRFSLRLGDRGADLYHRMRRTTDTAKEDKAEAEPVEAAADAAFPTPLDEAPPEAEAQAEPDEPERPPLRIARPNG